MRGRSTTMTDTLQLLFALVKRADDFFDILLRAKLTGQTDFGRTVLLHGLH